MDFTLTNFGFVLFRPPNPRWRIENMVNAGFHIIGFIVEGKGFYSFSGRRWEVGKGDLLFFPKGMEHSAHSDPDEAISYYSVAFDTHFLDPAGYESFAALPNIQPFSNLSQMLSLFSRLNRSWSAKEPGYLLHCRGLLLEILYLFQHESGSARCLPHGDAIERIIRHMGDHCDRPFSIEELAEFSGLSPSHFRALFKKATGVTAIQYQNGIRIGKARDLILSGECNVTEAALAVGFTDVYYFSRLFKKVMGVSPSSFLQK